MIELPPVADTLAVESPCTGHCELSSFATCRGCGRTLAEIVGWREFSPARRQEICDRLKAFAVE